MAYILVAEDDSAMRTFLKTALTKAGHTIDVAEDGIQALSAVTKNNYDLLLADIVMPGMDGVELATRAMDAHPQLKVMFITGFAAVAMGDHNPMAGSAKVLSKPFHLNDLVTQINQLLAA